MTREEAISYLQPIADSASLPRYAEALNMAIAALREQGGSFQNGNDHNTVKDWPSYMDLPREQEERSKCEWCAKWKSATCPMDGRRLEEVCPEK